jgi:AraC-like DNA-binding protein
MVAHASVRGSVVTAVLAKFARAGGDGDALLARYRLTSAMLSDPWTTVPLARYVAMFEEMADLLDDPLLGVRLGMETRPVDLGPTGLIMARSGSVRNALDRLARFVNNLQSGTHSALNEADDLLVLTYRLNDPAIWPRRQDAEFTLSSVIRMIRSAFDPDWGPIQVQFEHPAPSVSAARALRRMLGCPIRFEAASNGMVMALEEAKARFRDEDHDLIDVLERYLTDFTPSESLSDRWRDKVLALIVTYLGQQPVTTERLAADLRLSSRSLQRRLAEEGTSVRALLRSHREELADHHLQAGASNLGNLAEALGYADGTTFWRAHRNWTGQAPSAVRRRLTADQKRSRL